MKNQYVVAVIEDGIPKFSQTPRLHETEQDAVNEVLRLTRHMPGKQVAYFRCIRIAHAMQVVWE